MAKKSLAVFLSFVLIFCIASLTFAKKETTKKDVTAEETKVIAKKVVEPKDPLKEKTSISVDVMNQVASMRIWASNKMGIDFSAGLGFQSEPSTFAFNLGTGLVFPMLETERLYAYIVPSFRIGFLNETIETVSSNTFTLLAGADFEFEGFIVPEVLSIGSSFGVHIGIRNTEGSTSFIFVAGAATGGIGMKPLMVRFYF